MTEPFDARAFQTRLQRLEALLQQVERWSDPEAQMHVREIVQALLDLHRVGLERLLGHLSPAVLDDCAGEDVIAGMLLLHGLHPLELEARVLQALDEVRPYLRSHGGNVELLSLDDGVVRLRLEGNCDGCPSSAVTMRQTVEEAILGKAPDVAAVEVEGMVENWPAPADERGRVALPML